MPTRMIRDGILTSERVNMLSPNAELFYRRLMSVVDDYGRFSANLTLLRASCYPLKLDSVKEDSIKKHLAECVDAGLIVLYTVAGKALLEMQDFGQRVQAKSKYPAPAEENDEKQKVTDNYQKFTVIHGGSRGKTALVGDGVVVEDEGDLLHSPASQVPADESPPFCELPLVDGSAFTVTEKYIQDFAELYPAVDVRQEVREMRGWCIANQKRRKTKVGIMKFINSWLAKEQDKGVRSFQPMSHGEPPARRRQQL